MTRPAASAYVFDRAAAAKAVDFFEDYLSHVKGELAGQPLKLAPWQKHIIRDLFGTKRRRDGLRRYRTAYITLPRKNAKSTLGAGLALYLLLADEEPGAEIVSAAGDRAQAAIVFDIARSMVEANAELRSRVEIYQRSLVVRRTGSKYTVISSEAYSKHGMNLHRAVADELHVWPNRDLWDVIKTSQGARRQPLLIAITTAGSDPFSIGGEIHDYAEKVRDRVIDDPSFYPVIYGAPREADWTSERTWALCNPGLNTTVKLDYLRQECRTAQSSPAYENTFRQLHLNQWVSSSAQWIPNAAWAGCASPVDPAALAGRACVAGLDLSEKNDLSALVLLFPDATGGYDVLPFFWCPEEDIRRRGERDHAPYQDWVTGGFLTPTLGNLVDHEGIAEKIRDLGRRYAIREIGFDPWHGRQFAARLTAEGIPMIEVPQSKQALSPVAHELERLVLSGRLQHGGHPVLAWCLSNAVAKVDHLENIVITKAAPSARIDGVSALLMALSRAIVQPADEESELDRRVSRGEPPLIVL